VRDYEGHQWLGLNLYEYSTEFFKFSGLFCTKSRLRCVFELTKPYWRNLQCYPDHPAGFQTKQRRRREPRQSEMEERNDELRRVGRTLNVCRAGSRLKDTKNDQNNAAGPHYTSDTVNHPSVVQPYPRLFACKSLGTVPKHCLWLCVARAPWKRGALGHG